MTKQQGESDREKRWQYGGPSREGRFSTSRSYLHARERYSIRGSDLNEPRIVAVRARSADFGGTEPNDNHQNQQDRSHGQSQT